MQDDEDGSYDCSELQTEYPIDNVDPPSDPIMPFIASSNSRPTLLEDAIAEESPHRPISLEVLINGKPISKPTALRWQLLHWLNLNRSPLPSTRGFVFQLISPSTRGEYGPRQWFGWTMSKGWKPSSCTCEMRRKSISCACECYRTEIWQRKRPTRSWAEILGWQNRQSQLPGSSHGTSSTGWWPKWWIPLVLVASNGSCMLWCSWAADLGG